MSQIVSFEDENQARLERLKKVGLVAGVLLLCVGLWFGGRAAWKYYSEKRAIETSRSQLPDQVDAAQNLRLQGNAAESSKVIDDGLSDTQKADSERYQLYIQKGSLLVDANDYAGAVAAYSKAEELNQTYDVYGLLAETYVLMGDNNKAVEYYKKALPLIPDGPMSGADHERIASRIRALGGKL